MTTYSQIKLQLDGGVAVVTLNNPPVNAFSRVLSDELTHCLDNLSETDTTQAIVLIGEGRVFCAGADLKGRASVVKGPGDLTAHLRRSRECFHAIRECSKPVIAALNGPALGAGLVLAASADIIVASQTASLGLPEIDVGLMGGAGHASRLFSHSMLRTMALTGYRVPADELYRLGVVNSVVPTEELLSVAVELARKIAGKSPLAIKLSKQTLNAIEDMTLRDAYRYEQDMTVALGKTQDSQEAQKAFLEKRAPVFLGK
jgi:enoyl-CoA hydratase/carnithine racemase